MRRKRRRLPNGRGASGSSPRAACGSPRAQPCSVYRSERRCRPRPGAPLRSISGCMPRSWATSAIGRPLSNRLLRASRGRVRVPACPLETRNARLVRTGRAAASRSSIALTLALGQAIGRGSLGLVMLLLVRELRPPEYGQLALTVRQSRSSSRSPMAASLACLSAIWRVLTSTRRMSGGCLASAPSQRSR